MNTFTISLDFPHGHRLVRSRSIEIPKEIEVPVFLIRHELQSRMLFRHFRQIGFDECYFETCLDRLILASMNMWDGRDETLRFYNDLMDRLSSDIIMDEDELTRLAIVGYDELMKNRKEVH